MLMVRYRILGNGPRLKVRCLVYSQSTILVTAHLITFKWLPEVATVRAGKNLKIIFQ